MLVWLIISALFALFFRVLRFNSMPTINMNSISPIWLRKLMLPNNDAGNMKSKASGKYNPNNEGPNTTPARISPTTVGCPIFLQIHPKIRTVTRMTMICIMRVAIGCIMSSLRWLRKLLHVVLPPIIPLDVTDPK